MSTQAPSAQKGRRIFRLPRRRKPESLHSELSVIVGNSEAALFWEVAPDAMSQMSLDYMKAQRHLRRRDFYFFRELVLPSLVVYKARIAEPGNREKIGVELSRLATRIARDIETRAQYRARGRLARGLIEACIGTATLLTGVFAIFYYADHSTVAANSLHSVGYETIRDCLVCLLAGAAGAATSVLIRLRRIERVDYEAVSHGAAIVRVFLGVFFSLGVLMLTKSHVISFIADPGEDQAGPTNPGGFTDIEIGFFWGAVGYLAGFNERWVGGLIEINANPDEPGNAESSKGKKSASASDEPTEGRASRE